MTLLPHDVSDAMLAPVVLHVDRRLDDYGQMNGQQLRREIALLSNMPDRTRPQREAGLLRALASRHELHGWLLNLNQRGVQLSHSAHSVTLGVPAVVGDFLDGRW